MTLANKIRKALHDPTKVPPYLRSQFEAIARSVATRTKLRGKPSQKEWIDDLRDGDSWLLVILDACRYKEFADIASYVFEGPLQNIASEGHDTFEYVRLCWPDTYPQVTYVSGATPINSDSIEFDEEVVTSMYNGYQPHKHIGTIVDVWKTHWDTNLGIVPPWHITSESREYLDESRLVVHYFQPHAPYIGVERELGHHNNENSSPGEGEPVDAPLWDRVKNGEISDDRLKDLYRANLEAVVADVAKLVEVAPHDRIVIAGDHGEALGEYGTYAHPRVEHPYIRTVPWLEVTGVRDGWETALRTPKQSDSGFAERGSAEERLQDLGYI